MSATPLVPPAYDINADSLRLSARMSELCRLIPGKWVAFRDGEVRFTGDDFNSVMYWAMDIYGLGNCVLAEVRPDDTLRLR